MLKKINILVLLISFLFFSCDKKNLTNDEDAYLYDGDWSGATDQNEPISFTVENDEITFFALNITYPTGRIEGEDKSSPLGSINGDMFSVTLYWNKTIQIEGTFESLTSCNGTYSHNNGSGTWVVNKD